MMCVFHRAILWILHITSVSTTLVSGTLEINPHKKRKDFCSTDFCACKNICGMEILPSVFLFSLSEKLISAGFLRIFLFHMPGFSGGSCQKKSRKEFCGANLLAASDILFYSDSRSIFSLFSRCCKFWRLTPSSFAVLEILPPFFFRV